MGSVRHQTPADGCRRGHVSPEVLAVEVQLSVLQETHGVTQPWPNAEPLAKGMCMEPSVPGQRTWMRK